MKNSVLTVLLWLFLSWFIGHAAIWIDVKPDSLAISMILLFILNMWVKK